MIILRLQIKPLTIPRKHNRSYSPNRLRFQHNLILLLLYDNQVGPGSYENVVAGTDNLLGVDAIEAV